MAELVGKTLVTVDLDKPLIRKNVGLLMSKGDALANRFTVSLTRNGQTVSASGCTVYGYLIMPNDETLRIKGSVSGNQVHVEIPQSGYVCDGAFTLTIKVISDSMTKAVAIFDGLISKSTTGTIINDNRVLYGVDEILTLIDAMEQAEADANAAATSANSAATKANTATSNANTATSNANKATTNANEAASRANTAAAAIEGMTVSSSDVGADTPASAVISDVDGVKNIHFNLRQGITGATPNITFQVVTGEPGTQVEVSQSGTAENPIVNLTIPRGDTGAVDGVDYYAGNPAALGTASPGTANGLSRGDHVHPMPSASDIGIDVDTLVGSGMELIWENSAPLDSFGSQTITLADEYDLTQYKGIVIIVTADPSKSVVWCLASGVIPVRINEGYNLQYMFESLVRRGATIKATNKINFGNAFEVTIDGAVTSTNNPALMIPKYIYGIR